VTETDAFPGAFDESTGKLLVSGVFASFELTDAAGRAVEKLGSPARLRLLVPRDTWGSIHDVVAANAQIDVPLYAFDEVKGTWVRDGTGHLEDGNGNVIAPSLLPTIHAGAFTGGVYAVGNVSHFSTWNVDWPIESHGCVSGRLVDATGKPAEGATLLLRGVTYTGDSPAVTVNSDGRFCLDAMRSEAPGEDLEGNGKPGELATIALVAIADGKMHDLGIFRMPSAPAVCGGTGCFDVGNLSITPANVRSTALCTISGTVKYPDGTPAAGAALLFWDDDVPRDVAEALCTGNPGQPCSTTIVATDLDGSFTVTSPLFGQGVLWGQDDRELEPGATEISYVMRTFSSCPQSPVALVIEPRSIAVDFSVALVGNTISWSPSRYGITILTVRSIAGPRWEIHTDDRTTMLGPITYGVVPPGATQDFPPTGAPAPLDGRNVISIWTSGATIDGLPYFGEGAWLP